MCAVEGGRGALREVGDGVGGREEEGRAEAVVGVDVRWGVGHFGCRFEVWGEMVGGLCVWVPRRRTQF